MTDIDSHHVYYNTGFYECFTDERNAYFYIGNGSIFLYGYITQLIPGKAKLNITFINSYFDCIHISHITTKSYETVAENIIYNSIEEIVDINELIKLWHKYKNHKCNKEYHKSTTYLVRQGNLLNRLYVKPMKLVDYTIDFMYKNKLFKKNMEGIPFTLHDKINDYCGEEIFPEQSEFYYDLFISNC